MPLPPPSPPAHAPPLCPAQAPARHRVCADPGAGAAGALGAEGPVAPRQDLVHAGRGGGGLWQAAPRPGPPSGRGGRHPRPPAGALEEGPLLHVGGVAAQPLRPRCPTRPLPHPRGGGSRGACAWVVVTGRRRVSPPPLGPPPEIPPLPPPPLAGMDWKGGSPPPRFQGAHPTPSPRGAACSNSRRAPPPPVPKTRRPPVLWSSASK